MLPNKDGQMPRVENISCILPETAYLGGLFLGNVFGAQNPDILKEYGIRAVITTSAETSISLSIQTLVISPKMFPSTLPSKPMTKKTTTYLNTLMTVSTLSSKIGCYLVIQEVHQRLRPLLCGSVEKFSCDFCLSYVQVSVAPLKNTIFRAIQKNSCQTQ
jgi:hypothetical protein